MNCLILLDADFTDYALLGAKLAHLAPGATRLVVRATEHNALIHRYAKEHGLAVSTFSVGTYDTVERCNLRAARFATHCVAFSNAETPDHLVRIVCMLRRPVRVVRY